MKNPLQILLIAAFAVCAGGWFFSTRSAHASQEALEAVAARAARLEMEKAGFVSAFAAVRDGLLAQADSSKALEEALRESQSHRYARTEIVTEVRVDTVVEATADTLNETYHARLDSDPLFGQVGFSVPTEKFSIDLLCSPRLEQYIVQSANDQLLIGVRPLSPKTVVYIEAFDATPYLREKAAGGDSWMVRALIAAGGALAWELISK